jgi:hypothetical protein
VSHEGAGRHNRIHDAAINQFGDDQPLLGHGHGSGQGHDDERILVESHGLKHVGGLTQLASGKGGLGHRPDQAVDRIDLAEIERLERNQAVLDGIVQVPIFALTAGRVSLMRMVLLRMILWIALVSVFQPEPPNRANFPTRYSTGTT